MGIVHVQMPGISTMIPYQMNYRTIGVFLLLSVPFTQCQKVHELMTDDEIMYAFQTTRDKVPEYEIVAIKHSLRKRSIPQNFTVEFRAFDSNVMGYLNPIDGTLVGEDTPIWVAENRDNRIHYRKLEQGIMKEVLGFYQSVPDQAALVVRSSNDQNFQFQGVIASLAIIPLPDRIQQELRKTEKRKRDLSKSRRGITITHRHIVFKSNGGVNQTSAAQQSKESAVKKSEDILKQNATSKFKRSSEWTVSPSILVTSDFNGAMNSENDGVLYDQILYQMAFWNGVDLRFRQLKRPRVRLHIAGLVIGSDRKSTPYLNRYTINGEINVDRAQDEMEIYWSQNERNVIFAQESFHVVATVTNLKMFAINENSKISVEGRSTLSSVCLKSKNRFYPSMIFKDDLSFGGINNAAHELGHIFGALHDNQIACPSSDGYLMSPEGSTTVHNMKWSECSLNSIERFFRSRSCFDEPEEHHRLGKPLGRVLPGALKTADEQCQARGYDRSCGLTPGICKVLRCYSKGVVGFFQGCQDSWSAADGTKCGLGSYCIDGECLHPLREESLCD